MAVFSSRYMRQVMFTPSNGDRPNAPNVAVVVTDGASNRDQNLTIPNAVDAHRQGITMFAIGIGPNVNRAVCMPVTDLKAIKIHTKCFNDLTSGDQRNCQQVRSSLPCG